MKKLAPQSFVLLLIAIMLSCPAALFAQLERSDAFHQKYKLKSVVIFSRHNVRAPITGGSSLLGQMTNHEWIDWTADDSELTMKGGMLETACGEFFQKWAIKEGLFDKNAMPDSTEVRCYANSKQRTVSTARFFLSGFLPMSEIQVSWNGDLKKADPLFNGSFTNITQEMQDELQKEITEKYGVDGLRKLSESADGGLKLIQQVLDLKESPAYKEGKVSAFGDNPDHNWTMFFVEGNEPDTKGSIKEAASAADALMMQYYQNPDSVAAYFGNDLTMEQRRMIFRIKDLENGTRWTIPCIYKPLAQNFFNTLSSELKNENRKFYFMCGHDSNIFCILSGLELEDYDYPRPYAVEQHVPIGSKIVFEKWVDEGGKEYVGVNHVYQKIDQVRNIEVLTNDNPPMIIPLSLSKVKANEDGLYPFDEFVNFIDNVNSTTPSTKVSQVSSAAASAKAYTISGTLASESDSGIIIQGGKKVVK